MGLHPTWRFYQCRSTENAAWSRAVSVFEGDSANFGAMPPGVGKALSRYLVSGQSKRSRSCLEIDTTMGLALSDVSDAVSLGAEQTRQVLGKAAYQAVTLRQYWSIVPSLS